MTELDDAGGSAATANNSVAGSTGRHPRARLWLVACATLIMPELVVFGVIGFHDLFVSTRFGQRLLAGVFVFASLALAAGLVYVFASAAYQRWSVALLVIGSVPGFFLLAAQIYAREYSFFKLTLWAAFGVFPVSFAIAMWLGGARFERTKQVATLSSLGAVVLGFLPGLISPAFSSVSNSDRLSISAVLSNVRSSASSTKGYAEVRTSIKVKNDGDTKLLIIGSTYAIVGLTPRFRSPTESAKWPRDLPQVFNTKTGSPRYEATDKLQLVEMGSDLFGVGSWITPHEEATQVITSYVPVGKYHDLYAAVSVATANADRMAITGYYPYGKTKIESNDHTYLFSDYPMHQTFLGRLIQGNRTLEIQISTSTEDIESGDDLTVSVATSGHHANSYYDGTANYYGIFITYGFGQVTL